MDRVSIIVLFFCKYTKGFGVVFFCFLFSWFCLKFYVLYGFFYWFEVGFIFHGVLIVVFASILYFFIKGGR